MPTAPTKKPTMVTAEKPTTGRVITGSSDVAYTSGQVPTTETRDFWSSLEPKKAVSQHATDKAVLNQKPTIAAKVATDLANQKQSAAAATGVVNDTVASKAAAAARDAVQKNNSSTKTTVTIGVAAVAALFAGVVWYLKRKKKIA